MRHFSVIINAQNQEEIRNMMMPFYEYGSGCFDNLAKPYLVWESVEDEYRQKYKDGFSDFVVAESPTHHNTQLLRAYDERFRVSGIPDDLRKIQIPHGILYPTFEIFMDEWASGYEQDQNGNYGHWYNPNKKWDWYKIGGRFSNSIILKSGVMCDTAVLRDVDFAAMRDSYARDCRKRWQQVSNTLKPHCTIQEYNEKPPKERRAINESIGGDFWSSVVNFDFDKAGSTAEDEYNRRYQEAQFYALLDKDGWMGRGEMIWFGISIDEQDDYDAEFWNRISKWKPEDRIYVLDCHI
jgi:hypothetical protein